MLPGGFEMIIEQNSSLEVTVRALLLHAGLTISAAEPSGKRVENLTPTRFPEINQEKGKIVANSA